MSKLGTAAVLTTTCAALLATAAPAGAAPAPTTRPLISGHVSISAVQGSLPVGATVSVLQTCPAGSKLDRAATRELGGEADEVLDRNVRLASREFWPAGTVSRYRVVRRTSAEEGQVFLNIALCRTSVAATATTVSGRASTDLRVWGPAPSRLGVANATVAAVTDDIDAEDAFATVMQAGGVASSKGSLTGALRAVQKASNEEGLGAVAAVGETRKAIRRGSFISMLNSYRYTSDLTRKVAPDTAAP